MVSMRYRVHSLWGQTHLGCFPDGTGILAVLLDEGQDACCDDAVRLAEVVVDFWPSVSMSVCLLLYGGSR